MPPHRDTQSDARHVINGIWNMLGDITQQVFHDDAGRTVNATQVTTEAITRFIPAPGMRDDDATSDALIKPPFGDVPAHVTLQIDASSPANHRSLCSRCDIQPVQHIGDLRPLPLLEVASLVHSGLLLFAPRRLNLDRCRQQEASNHLTFLRAACLTIFRVCSQLLGKIDLTCAV